MGILGQIHGYFWWSRCPWHGSTAKKFQEIVGLINAHELHVPTSQTEDKLTHITLNSTKAGHGTKFLYYPIKYNNMIFWAVTHTNTHCTIWLGIWCKSLKVRDPHVCFESRTTIFEILGHKLFIGAKIELMKCNTKKLCLLKVCPDLSKTSGKWEVINSSSSAYLVKESIDITYEIHILAVKQLSAV